MVDRAPSRTGALARRVGHRRVAHGTHMARSRERPEGEYAKCLDPCLTISPEAVHVARTLR
jgi:hypothetical protein